MPEKVITKLLFEKELACYRLLFEKELAEDYKIANLATLKLLRKGC
jgi:hypothetical protein